MKKILLIQPPQWYPITPHLAVPLLAAQLKKAGFQTDIADWNVRLFNRILTSEFLSAADETAQRDLEALSPEYVDADLTALRENGSYAEKTRALKYLTLKRFYEEHGAEIPAVIHDIGFSVRTMREPALFYDPELILMDEPFSALDYFTRRNLQDMVLRLFQHQKKTILFVTHDVEEALLLGDRILVMENGSIKADMPVPLPFPRKAAYPALQDMRQRILDLLAE